MFDRDFELPGKSAALGQNGMVATSHPRASLAGLDALRDGGNAIDAAVCAAAVQAVVEPTQTGIGGDCFALFMREGDSVPSALNGSGWAPEAASLGWYRQRAFSEIGVETPHAVTVPGALAAWERLITDHGRLPWDRVLSPAIEAAEMGSCVPERLARDWGKQVEKLRRNAATARLFLFDGKAPLPGQVHRQPQLAKTLREIARSGASAFYNGPLAAAMISTLRVHGGLHVDEDFASFAAEYVQPISVAYRGYDLWECPPNGQGVVPMLIAKGLEGFDLSAWASTSVERFHVMAELARQAYAERDLYVGDPRTSENLVDWLLSHDHVRVLRSHVSLEGRIADVGPVLQRPHRDTVFIAVVDRDRMAVSLINSLFED